MTAYYNEFEPFAAKWLRGLISQNLIAPGDVDERSIKDVKADDLRKYTQCHFFAGIGVWSHALRSAGWPDDRAVWTGSCPCQPFSAAGKGEGFDDPRHLWPSFHRLIRESRPVTVFGEQVSSKDGLTWFDLVSTDLERTSYTVGAVDSCAAGFGAPHLRQRLYFVADSGDGAVANTNRNRPSQNTADSIVCGPRHVAEIADSGASSGMANTANGIRLHGRDGGKGIEPTDQRWWRQVEPGGNGASRDVGDTDRGRFLQCDQGQRPVSESHAPITLDQLGDTNGTKFETRNAESSGTSQTAEQFTQPSVPNNLVLTSGEGLEGFTGDGYNGNQSRRIVADPNRSTTTPSATNGFWSDADWLYCRDEKYRAVEPGTFPLAHGSTNRVGRLRGYGNALCAKAAQGFIEAYLEIRN